MSKRYRDGEFSWREWYVAIRGRQDDDSKLHTSATLPPACTNCGTAVPQLPDPSPERCPECWAKLQVGEA